MWFDVFGYVIGWSDVAYGGQPTEGKSRKGFVIGSMSSTLSRPRHVLQWTSKFARKLAKSGLGGEVYAPSEMVGHVSLFRDFYGTFDGLNPGMAGLEDCESLLTHPKTKEPVAEKYLVRHA